jgi:hypothetical protein
MADAPFVHQALERWIAVAGIAPGSPLFRSLRKGGRVQADRLSGHAVDQIIRERMAELEAHRG